MQIRQLTAEKAAQVTNELTPIESIMEEDMPEYIHKVNKVTRMFLTMLMVVAAMRTCCS